MKVIVLGLRALPGVAGGVESHCEHLYPLVAAAGIDVEILIRSAYVPATAARDWRGVRLRRIWSPRKPGIEVLIHTFLGILYAAFRRPHLLHLHSIGPAVFAPMAKLLGLHVVVTYHAPDYEQSKWGRLAKWVLKTGERLAMRHADEVICISRHGADRLEREYNRRPNVIPNGVPTINPPNSHSLLHELGIEPGRYVLHVGRAMVDKRQDDLIRAFAQADLTGWRLVLVGDFSGGDAYCSTVRRLASEVPHVILAGYRCGAELQALLAHAGCFALPSATEGFSIALLEALSAGCVAVASDIPANREAGLPPECYFPAGDVAAMANALATIPVTVPRQVWDAIRKRVHEEHDWSHIASETARLYRHTLRATPRRYTNESAAVNRNQVPR